MLASNNFQVKKLNSMLLKKKEKGTRLPIHLDIYRKSLCSMYMCKPMTMTMCICICICIPCLLTLCQCFRVLFTFVMSEMVQEYQMKKKKSVSTQQTRQINKTSIHTVVVVFFCFYPCRCISVFRVIVVTIVWRENSRSIVVMKWLEWTTHSTKQEKQK